jgi:hypothetical protein
LFAAILETSDPQRLYTGLSLVVSAASDGEPVRVLLGFGALAALSGGALDAGADVLAAEREPFRRTLGELWAATLELCEVQACAAAAQATGIDRLSVISMPQFVREVADARLVVL